MFQYPYPFGCSKTNIRTGNIDRDDHKVFLHGVEPGTQSRACTDGEYGGIDEHGRELWCWKGEWQYRTEPNFAPDPDGERPPGHPPLGDPNPPESGAG